jgi:prepilin peptidase CpaA
MPLLTIINQASVILMAVCLIVASISDVKSYRIPNILSVIIFCLFFVWYYTAERTSSIPTNYLIAFGLVFGIGFVLFTFRLFGGGDVKLLSAVSLWAGVGYLLDIIVLMALIGGAMAVGALVYVIVQRRIFNNSAVSITKSKLPYGVAISVAGLWLAIQYATPIKHWIEGVA